MKKIAIVFVFLLLILMAIEQWMIKNEEREEQVNADQQEELLQKDLENTDQQEDLSQNVTVPEVGLEIGEQAPEFSLETLDGGNLALQDLKGKVVLLNFWASWCPPCRAEMPDMQKVYEQYKDENIEIVAVNLTYGRETVELAKNFQEELNLTFPIPLDKTAEVTKMYQIIPIPTSYFIDREGIIQDKKIGPMTEDEMVEKLEKLK